MNDQRERKQVDDLQSMRQASRLWGKDVRRDDVREEQSDDKRLNKIDKCPHIRTLQGGDESMDICDIVDKGCLIEHGQYKCEIWDEIRLNKKEGNK